MKVKLKLSLFENCSFVLELRHSGALRKSRVAIVQCCVVNCVRNSPNAEALSCRTFNSLSFNIFPTIFTLYYFKESKNQKLNLQFVSHKREQRRWQEGENFVGKVGKFSLFFIVFVSLIGLFFEYEQKTQTDCHLLLEKWKWWFLIFYFTEKP